MNFARVIEYILVFVVLFYTICILLIFLQHRKRMTGGRKKNWEPRISVVIPAYNEEKNIGKALRSLLSADYPKEKMEIIVVNDGSRDRTAEVVEGYKNVILLNKQNEGKANALKANALNYGIKRAKGEVIMTLDADSYVTKKAIRKVLGCFDDDVAAVTSAVKIRKKKKAAIIEKIQRIEYLFTIFNRKIFSFINGVYVTPGPLSAFKADVFKELGGFDEKNIMEDQEMALRIQSANYRIESCIDAVVFTEVPKDIKSFYRQRVRWHRGGIRNVFSYGYLASPRYGDFGTFVMPVSIASFFLLIGILFIVSLSMTKAFSPPNLDFSLAFEPLHVLSATIILLTIIWTALSLKYMEEKPNIPLLVAYILSYCYMISLFTIISIFKELKGEPVSW